MASVGYSGTPLWKKLGMKEGKRALLVDAPGDYEHLVAGRPPLALHRRAGTGTYDLIHVFVRDKTGLKRRLLPLRDRLARDGMLWISWPKKASGIEADIDETAVRTAGLAAGLVDVKVCAVDATWSGLKFVFRLADR